MNKIKGRSIKYSHKADKEINLGSPFLTGRFKMKTRYNVILSLITVLFWSFSLVASNVMVDPQREDTNLQEEQSRGLQINEDKYLQQEQTRDIQFREDKELQQEQTRDVQFYEDQNLQQEKELNRI